MGTRGERCTPAAAAATVRVARGRGDISFHLLPSVHTARTAGTGVLPGVIVDRTKYTLELGDVMKT